jgi:glycosyltransferase 2 family protein
MTDLQAAVVEATQQQLPEPVKLLRIRGRSLIMSGLLLLTAWALIPLLAGIDYEAVWDILQDAEWTLIFIALIFGQIILLTEAVGMTFAVAQTSLPFWPLVTLQSAAKFIGLAVPGVAGRVTMNAAFLHKFGVPVAMSTTQGAIDSFSGFLVEAAILIVGILSTDLEFDTEDIDIEWVTILVVALVLVGLTVIAVRRIRALREKVMPVIREGWGALVAVLRDPRRAIGLVGSNLATRLVMAAALWIILLAVDVRLGFGVALAVVVATNLLGGFVPVPGGIGVAEAAMTAFLVGFGVEESVAFAATLTYRVVTFYLPAVIGFPSMRWLERNSYL